KQEELGLGSDEVLLYGGDEYFHGPTRSQFPGHFPGKNLTKNRTRGHDNRDSTFPSASAMADALSMDPYGGFDIMDTERPSLKVKKKGRRGHIPLELDDSDLNEQLQNAWEADRTKKRLKKAEREELRQQGLLGRKSKGKSAALKVKYSGGIAMDDVVEEIREFLLSDRQSLSLPPMDAQRRAIIHQVANFFELSSLSRGKGQDRHTVLSRRLRTRMYTDSEFDLAISRKGFLKRLHGPLQGKHGTGSARAPTFRSGPHTRPQVGYRDGDKVGANAPELGPENRGHALMMKMGWSKGMALGTEDNQGILQPIAHTVKTNKAGLQ
ncbi:squalene synthetase-like protein, partial [Pleosporales sp. CAS-2024a]